MRLEPSKTHLPPPDDPPVDVRFQTFAQIAGTASVQRSVSDTTGALVVGAKVTMTATATGAVRTIATDAEGRYSLPNLPVGAYVLNVAAQGFQTYQQTNLMLEVGNNVTINVSLKAGSSEQKVVVEASGTMLETQASSFKQVIDRQRITEMPLNGRQATQLVLISGGAVTAPTGDLIGSKTYASSTVIAVAGNQGNYNNHQLDGGTHVDTFTNVNLPFPFS